MGIVRFYGAIIWLGVLLALTGQARSCTRTMLGMAADSTERGIMSYSKFTKQLWGPVKNP